MTSSSRGWRTASAFATIVVLLVTWFSPRARADLIDEAWKRGNDAYFRGDYPEAVAAYEQLDRQGIASADLFYNLGVAYFRQAQLGRAIWSFERAVALDPDAEDASFNLTQTRKRAAQQAVDKIENDAHEPFWMRVVTALTSSTETWLFLIFYVLTFALLFVRRSAAEHARAFLSAAAAILGVGALLTGLLLGGRAVLERIPFGIVLPETVAVKEGADPNYRTSFDVHAGLRVRLVDREHGWVRIRLTNGLEGWVKDANVGRL